MSSLILLSLADDSFDEPSRQGVAREPLIDFKVVENLVFRPT